MATPKVPNPALPRPLTGNALGAAGETRAAEHLTADGYRVLARNARVGGVEVDLVVARGPLLVFVEVKTRRSRRAGLPEESVDARKQERLRRAALAWLHDPERPAPRGARVRFDVIACEVDGAGQWSVRHLRAAFDGSA